MDVSGIKVDKDKEFPAVHDTEISYKCSRKHAKKDVNEKAVCQDGKIVFSSGESSSSCSRIG